jgi:hypothetical protein
MTIQFTIFEKPAADGPMSKVITLVADGPVSDGSTCSMAQGTAVCREVADLAEFAEVLNACTSQQALATGTLSEEAMAKAVDGAVRVVVEKRLAAEPAAISRTKRFLHHRPGQPGLLLIDYDQKGMPDNVRDRVKELGGTAWDVLLNVFPALADVGCVVRASTSAGLSDPTTGRVFDTAGGEHVYIVIADADDAVRTLGAMHKRLWLAGFGWHIVATDGSLLERSVIDRVVGSPERLVFEGAPVLHPPLMQDAAKREAVVRTGNIFDTRAVVQELSPTEQAHLRAMLAESRHALGTAALSTRTAFDNAMAREIVQATGAPFAVALDRVRLRHDGRLPPEWPLVFDDPLLGTVSVATVMADPTRFVGETLADPVEGIAYGRCKAKLLGGDGQFVIHSFAHGRAIYRLVYDEAAILAVMTAASPAHVLSSVARAMIGAVIDHAGRHRIMQQLAATLNIGVRAVDRAFADAIRQAQQAESAEAASRLAFADTRIPMDAPKRDAEPLATVRPIDAILARHITDPNNPPLRNPSGHLMQVEERTVSAVHELLDDHRATDEKAVGALSKPAMARLRILSTAGVKMLVEGKIRFERKTRDGVEVVGLPDIFVPALTEMPDPQVPYCSGLQTLPVVLPARVAIAMNGYDPDLKLLFRIHPDLLAIMPQAEDCNVDAGRAAFRFLCDQWLCDVDTTSQGKAIIVAMALTIIERHLLSERLAFLFVAGQRGGGKTTAVNMVSAAVLGRRAAAAAWSDAPDERRKALFAAFSEGLDLLVFDNMPRGAAIGCPHIDKALTSPTFRDRVLGVSRQAEVPSTTILAFTGNSITARGDFASRSLPVHINVDRPDPENRTFKHPDPVAWTLAHRKELLAAFYTILLVERPNVAQPKTRFKQWWQLVGHPIEIVSDVDFARLFTANEMLDEEATGAAVLFAALDAKFKGKQFDAINLAALMDPEHGLSEAQIRLQTPEERADRRADASAIRGALEEACGGRSLPPGVPSAVRVGKKLKALVGRTVAVDGEKSLRLRAFSTRAKQAGYFIEELGSDGVPII